MSVSASLTLPSQPTAGGTKFVPLAGNGLTAPQSAYAVSIQLTGDASGGTATVTLRPDPQYATIVSYVGWSTFATASQTGLQLSIVNGDETVTVLEQPPHAGVGGTNPQQALVWSPPLMVLDPPQDDPRLVLVVPNEDGATFSATFRLYNFRKGVQNVTPLPLLVAALPRSTNTAP